MDYEKCRYCKNLDKMPTDEPCIRCKDNDHFAFIVTEEEQLKHYREIQEKMRENMPLDDGELLRCYMDFHEEKPKDNINPDHYKSETSLECIEAMEIIFGVEAVCKFCLCNAWKYVWRWKNKNGTEDLKKAMWYIDRAKSYDVIENSNCLDGLYNYILNNLEDSNA